MPRSKQYNVVITETALRMIDEKYRYVASFLFEPETAKRWLVRMSGFLRKNLSSFPYKYPVYRKEQYGDVYHIVCFHNDVIIYDVDDDSNSVYVDLVTTKGRNLERLIELCMDVKDVGSYND